MATEGFQGFYVETRDYGAAAGFWASMGFESVFESEHGSGQWVHPTGGPYVFISEQREGELETHPILGVADAEAFSPDRRPDFAMPFTPRHWNVLEAHVRDPDGRIVSLQAPVPDGVEAPDADAHHAEKYGHG
jgi:hypothetical protein